MKRRSLQLRSKNDRTIASAPYSVKREIGLDFYPPLCSVPGMIRSLNSCHVGTEPWAPEVFVEKPKPMEPQVAHRFCVLLLKGCSTRWCDTEEQMRKLVETEREHKRRCLVLEHFNVPKGYVVTGGVEIPSAAGAPAFLAP